MRCVGHRDLGCLQTGISGVWGPLESQEGVKFTGCALGIPSLPHSTGTQRDSAWIIQGPGGVWSQHCEEFAVFKTALLPSLGSCLRSSFIVLFSQYSRLFSGSGRRDIRRDLVPSALPCQAILTAASRLSPILQTETHIHQGH